MTRVMLIGDINHGLYDIHETLKDQYDVYPVAFMDYQERDISILPDAWYGIDFRDFHELTIRIMEFEPDVVIYLSYYLRPARVLHDPDLADMAHPEAVEHLRQIVDIPNSHLILIHSNVSEIGNGSEMLRLLESYQKQAETMIDGMNKQTILSIPHLVDSSSEGILAWSQQDDSTITTPWISVDEIVDVLVKSIKEGPKGKIDVVKEAEQLPKKPHSEFQGDPMNFQYLSD